MAQQRCSRRFIDNAEQTKRACPPRESTPADGRSRAANEKKEDAFSSLPPYPASYLFFFPTFNENLKPDAPTGKRFRALWHKNMPVQTNVWLYAAGFVIFYGVHSSDNPKNR